MASKKIRRRDLIQQVVRERGGVSVGALAEMLGVSTQTIRRDLDLLCDGKNLRRAHGRIELAESQLNTPFDQRAGTNLTGKRAIADLAETHIPDGATIFISIGSSTLNVARALRRRKELTVITNNLSAAMAVSEEMSNRIIIPGGESGYQTAIWWAKTWLTFLRVFGPILPYSALRVSMWMVHYWNSTSLKFVQQNRCARMPKNRC